MRRLAWTVLIAAGIVGVACGLDVSGEGGLSLPDRADGGNIGDAMPVGDLPEAGTGIDPGTETPLEDAGQVEAGSCGPATFAENFAKPIAAPWITYGKVAQTVNGSNGFARLIATGEGGQAAGLFYAPTVSATSFVVSFRYFAQRPYVDWWETPAYADGFTFTWLTEADLAALGKGEAMGAVTGSGLGLTKGSKGFGFALDCYRNSAPQDLDGPSFYVFNLDSAKGNPGSYPWHLEKRGPYTGVYDAWHTVVATFAGGKLSVTIDNSAKIFTAVDVPATKIKALGFTAATGGGDSVGFFVDTVDIKLTDATCP